MKNAALKNLAVLAVFVFAATPALAVFTEDFAAKPFGKTGDWSRAGNVAWEHKVVGNEFVSLGRAKRDTGNLLWTSFTAQTTGEYSVGFDYRFIGRDINPGLDDLVTVQIGAGAGPLYNVFEAASGTGLTGSKKNPGSWQSFAASGQTLLLEAGQTYWLRFGFDEVQGTRAPVTLFQLDNVCLNQIIKDDIVPAGDDDYPVTPVVPAPGAVLLGGIGVGFVGWLRRGRAL